MASVYFDPAVGGNGSTVSDDANPSTGLANGGHRTRFVPALGQVVAVADFVVNKAFEADASADAAAASAATALSAPGTSATSTTSLAIGTGSKSLTLAQTGKSFAVGQYVQIVSTASTDNWMVGAITAFTPGTGAMTVNVTNTGGSGTIAAWGITPTNPPELPSQSGNAGKALFTDGSNEYWAATDVLPRSARTSNTILGVADKNTLIDITSGTFSQTFAAAATLGSGWWCYIRNAGTGDITLDPNASETIDGLASYVMYPGEVRLVQCDGTALRTVVLNAFYRTFTASGTFTVPPGYALFSGLLWGGGGSGAKGQNYGGGGGGGCTPFSMSAAAVLGASATLTVTLGAGGVGPTFGSTAGNAGGSSTITASGFNTITAGGGSAVGGSTGASGGSGGGIGSAGGAGDFGGGAGGSGSSGGSSVYGGGGGGPGGISSSGGGSSFNGGGGGGGAPGSGTTTGGASTFGGAGGGGAYSASGTDGTAPGGGGGSTYIGTKAGDGARGELRIWGII